MGDLKLAFSTNAYTGGDYTLPEAIRKIAEIEYKGYHYQGVELLGDKPLLWPPMAPGESWDPPLEEVAKALQETGLEVANINGNTAAGYFGDRTAPPGQTFGPSFGDPDPQDRAWRVEYTKRLIDAAQFLGAKNLCVTSGFLQEEVPYEEAFENTRSCLEECLRYAEGKGVELAIEYEPGLILGDARSTLQMIKTLGSPSLGVNLDIGHVHVCKEDFHQVITDFGPRIKTTHFEDILGEVHEHLIPGLGDLSQRFPEILRRLREVGYQGYIILELYPYSKEPVRATEEALRYFVDHREELRWEDL